MHILLCAWNWTFTQILTQPPAVLRHFRRCCQHSLWLQPSSHKSCQILSPFPSQSSSLLRSPSTLISVSSAVSSATQPHLGKPQHKKSLFIWALPVWGGGGGVNEQRFFLCWGFPYLGNWSNTNTLRSVPLTPDPGRSLKKKCAEHL